MARSRHIDLICCAALLLAVIICAALFIFGGSDENAGGTVTAPEYESSLFDASAVHTLDISMDDWDGFIKDCEDEEYALCDVTIDGENLKNVGIRAKGNTSLSSVSSLGSSRYSFKIEFDHYDDSISYHGLDKLSLNNIIQDNSYMKDFLCYQLMNSFDADSPLCSYVYITVNGEDWGLYLAVEGVEESFLERNYGSDYGELYKPDSSDMGGGRGNGGKFDMSGILDGEAPDMPDGEAPTAPDGNVPEMPNGDMQAPGGDMQMPSGDMQAPGGDMQIPGGDMQMPNGDMQMPSGDMQMPGGDMQVPGGDMQVPGGDMPEMPDNNVPDAPDANGGGFSMGSSDVSLIYSDDDPDSYPNIFDNAKTKVSSADKSRLIESLKKLNANEDIESVVNVDEVLRYFVVHNFVCNFDSYTGSMIHNYYLYEDDGQLSMIAWDYNLAFGGFESGADASSLVNYPIDSPVSGGTTDSRPMLAWIFADDEYTELYHEYFAQFIEDVFSSGDFEKLIDSTAQLIAPYVEKDPTKFCTYEEFETGWQTLRSFCLLRAQSVSAQLEGSIPSTSEGQQADKSGLIDASTITISDMGGMGSTMGGGRMDMDMDINKKEDFFHGQRV